MTDGLVVDASNYKQLASDEEYASGRNIESVEEERSPGSSVTTQAASSTDHSEISDSNDCVDPPREIRQTQVLEQVNNTPLEVCIQLASPINSGAAAVTTSESSSSTPHPTVTKSNTGSKQKIKFSMQVGLSFGDFLLRYLKRNNPEDVAIQSSEPHPESSQWITSLTYGGLLQHIQGVRSWIQDQRSPREDVVVATLASNSPECCAIMHGAISAGALVTPCSVLNSVDELRSQLADSGAVVVATEGKWLAKLVRAARGTKISQLIILGDIDDLSKGALRTVPESKTFELLCGPDHAISVSMYSDVARYESTTTEASWKSTIDIDPSKRVALLPYTAPLRGSGTGLLRGVPLTHENLVAQLLQLGQTDSVFKISPASSNEISVPQREVILATLPFFDPLGFVSLLTFSLCRGHCVVAMPMWSPESVGRTVHQFRVSVLPLLSCMADSLAKYIMDNPGGNSNSAPDSFSLGSVRTLWLWTSPQVSSLLERHLVRRICEHASTLQNTDIIHPFATDGNPVDTLNKSSHRVRVVRCWGLIEAVGITHYVSHVYALQESTGSVVRVAGRDSPSSAIGKLVNRATKSLDTTASRRLFHKYFVEIGEAIPGIDWRTRKLDSGIVPESFYEDCDFPSSECCIGELQIRGLNVVGGYWNATQVGAEHTTTDGVFTSDGYLNTGYIGFHVEGSFWLLGIGNLNAQQFVQGFQVDCHHVELAIRSFEGTKNCVVFFVNELRPSEPSNRMLNAFRPVVKTVIEHENITEDTPDAVVQAMCHKLEEHLKNKISVHNLPKDDDAQAAFTNSKKSPRPSHHGLHFVSSLSSLATLAGVRNAQSIAEGDDELGARRKSLWSTVYRNRQYCSEQYGRQPSMVKLLNIAKTVRTDSITLLASELRLKSGSSSPASLPFSPASNTEPNSQPTNTEESESRNQVAELRGLLSETRRQLRAKERQVREAFDLVQKTKIESEVAITASNQREECAKIKCQQLQDDLQDEKHDRAREEHQMERKVKRLQEQVSTLTVSESQLKSQTVQLENQIDSILLREGELCATNKQLQAKITELESKYRIAQRSQLAYEERAKEATLAAKQTSELLCNERTLRSAAVRDLDTARPAMLKLQSRLSKLEMALSSSRAREKSNSIQLKRDRENYKVVQDENLSLNRTNGTLKTRISQLEHQLQDLQAIRTLEFEANASKFSELFNKQARSDSDETKDDSDCTNMQASRTELVKLVQQSRDEITALITAHETVQRECESLSRKVAQTEVLERKCAVLEMENAIAVNFLAKGSTTTVDTIEQPCIESFTWSNVHQENLDIQQDICVGSPRSVMTNTSEGFHSTTAGEVSGTSPRALFTNNGERLNPCTSSPLTSIQGTREEMLLMQRDVTSPVEGQSVTLPFDTIDRREEVVRRYVRDLNMLFSLGGIRFPLLECPVEDDNTSADVEQQLCNVYAVVTNVNESDTETIREENNKLVLGVAQGRLVAAAYPSSNETSFAGDDELQFQDLLDILAAWTIVD